MSKKLRERLFFNIGSFVLLCLFISNLPKPYDSIVGIIGGVSIAVADYILKKDNYF